MEAHIGGTRRFVFHPWRGQKTDRARQENPSGNQLAVLILDRGFVTKTGERGGDGDRMEGQHQGELR